MPDIINMDEIIMTALKEDMPFGDITTDSLIDAGSMSRARLISKDVGIIAGIAVAERVFKLLDKNISFGYLVRDGAAVKKGDIIATVEGSTRAMLKGERTALNFLQRLSGIATKTNEFCKKVEGMQVKIADTRKTTPGLRLLEKYAVKVGGGCNHRYCLSDGVLIKDNHIKAAGGIRKAVENARSRIPHTMRIEVETETLEQVGEALECRVDIIMLDNMNPAMMRDAVKMIDKRAVVEASGDMNLDILPEIASTGVDIISVGKITHSVNALDISMRFE